MRAVLPIGLFVAATGCGGKAPPTSPEPVGTAPLEPPIGNPPPPVLLPSWDQVASTHPVGATNPPSPVLLTTVDGRCYKWWASPWLPKEQHEPHVADCAPGDSPECGTEIRCPTPEERAAWGIPTAPTGEAGGQ